MNTIFDQFGHFVIDKKNTTNPPSNTKNHAVKNVPIARRTVAKCGNTVGFTGEMYLDNVASILIDSSLTGRRF